MSFAILDGAIAEMEQKQTLAEEARRREEVRLKAENDRRMREEAMLRTLQMSSDYLLNVCDMSMSAGAFSMKGFSDAVTGLMGLGELCGTNEMDLIHRAILARPELLYFVTLRMYFRKTQDAEVGSLYLERFLTIPETSEEINHNHPTVVAAKQALAIAAENYGSEKKEMMKKFALLILDRFPGMPGTEHQGFKALILAISRSGVLKEESIKIPSGLSTAPKTNHFVKPAPGSKIPDEKYVAKMAAADRVQATVLPGVTVTTDRLAAFVENNASARARANRKHKVG